MKQLDSKLISWDIIIFRFGDSKSQFWRIFLWILAETMRILLCMFTIHVSIPIFFSLLSTSGCCAESTIETASIFIFYNLFIYLWLGLGISQFSCSFFTSIISIYIHLYPLLFFLYPFISIICDCCSVSCFWLHLYLFLFFNNEIGLFCKIL